MPGLSESSAGPRPSATPPFTATRDSASAGSCLFPNYLKGLPAKEKFVREPVSLLVTLNYIVKVIAMQVCIEIKKWRAKSSVTRSGDLLDFGQLFKAFGYNLFAQISHILRQFL